MSNVDIKEGEFVSIMGPSGAGKSTLLHIIGMHDSAWTGEYWFLGHPVHAMDKKQRAELHKKYMGFVFQSYHLLDHLTVYENLDVPLSYRNVKKSERDSIVCDILDRFSIVGKKDLYPNQLSGGQQQLVAVARAIIANPKVILADEPTGNLHSEQGREIMELFKKLNADRHDDRPGDALRDERARTATGSFVCATGGSSRNRRWSETRTGGEAHARRSCQLGSCRR